MAPAATSGSERILVGDYQVVAWDLDTTGRRLIDEICQIGGYYVSRSGEPRTFSQYVMPYGNPNQGARRSFGIRVVSVGRFRMLKAVDTGKVLKTKSEISALNDFIDWLKEARGSRDGVLLACHEPNRKVLIPLLLEALHKYRLVDEFAKVVQGFVNGVAVVEALGNREIITSYSLRSLCKTVLSDTSPSTTSASNRSKVLVQILTKLCSSQDGTAAVKSEVGEADSGDSQSTKVMLDSSKLVPLAVSVKDEELELKNLKDVLDTQSTLRPIFEAQLHQKKSVRDRAVALRRMLAESGLDYKTVSDMCPSSSLKKVDDNGNQGRVADGGELEASQAPQEDSNKVMEDIKAKLKAKVASKASDEDLDELVGLFHAHFCSPVGEGSQAERNQNRKATAAGPRSLRNKRSKPSAAAAEKNPSVVNADDEAAVGGAAEGEAEGEAASSSPAVEQSEG